MTCAAVADLNAWQTRRVDQRSRAAMLARLERLEHWQTQRRLALAELSDLITRRELEIENLRGQLA